jgi:hypothetical protein
MSQQTNAGFNAPGFSVGSREPDSASPRIATSPALLPASFCPFFAGANDVGVGQTARPSRLLIGTFGVKQPSL